MIKYFSFFLLLCFSCASTKVAEPQIKEGDSVIEDNATRKDDSQEIPPPAIDISELEDKKEESHIVDFPSKEASFPGGDEAMETWISENLKYPEKAIESKTSGKVYVQFIVLKDGSIEEISIMRGVSDELNQEAKRLVKTMPKWTPGENKGGPVNVRCRIPILFELN